MKRAKENTRFQPMECQYYKVHTLIKLSGCCLFTIPLSHLSSQVFAKDCYHQPSVCNLCVTNAHIQCIHKKGNQNRLLPSSHIRAQKG
jgi:hypothetical protein